MEPIAITGIGCRLPGESNGPEALWKNLLAGRDLITETPPDRWSLDAFYHPDPALPGHTYTRWGGYLAHPEQFDAGFFGIPPREASRMDPQQRWLLETTWEALEDAGYPWQRLAGSNVGVYIGISSCDYGDIQKRGRYEVDAYTNSGNALSIAANRISYLLDFRGPSLSVDTACSSSLVALDLACRALDRGDIPLAVVGGANALLTPDLTIGFSKAMMLSPDGRCRTFDANANGYVRSEGAVCVILKPLSAALADRDRIYAVIRSTYVNQDGRTGSMTVPSVEQQARMLREAYRRAEVDPQFVGFIEAHGTGTRVGDPIEATALGRVFGAGRSKDQPLWIGSIKSNLGHLEPASGVTGLAKLALALYHRTIPPNLHFREPNPQVPFEQYHLRVPTEPVAWEPRPGEQLLFGGVNSFGFGGTNAHAVLSSAAQTAGEVLPPVPDTEIPLRLWTVSARSREALREAVRRDAAFLDQAQGSFTELVATVQQRRSHHAHRVGVLAADAREAAERLRSWAEHGKAADLVAGQAGNLSSEVVFVFSGQGSQWPGMAVDLLEQEPVFRDTLDQLDALMWPRWGRSLVEALRRGDDSVFRTDIGQPLIFAVQVGLARVLESWGIRPARVLGHSVGEVAAAHIAGALSVEEAVHLIVGRSRAQERTRGSGSMAAVGVSLAEIRPFLAPYAGRVEVAAINSLSQLTLAGDTEAVEAVTRELTARGKFARELPIPYAFHTRAMDPIRAYFEKSVGRLHPRPTGVPFTSTVTGTDLAGEALGVEYWWRNIREPVQFVAAVRHAIGGGQRIFVEIGPHPSLTRYLQEVLKAEKVEGTAVDTLRRQEPGPRCLREALATLHVNGATIDWGRLTPSDGRHRAFPRYPWQRQSFWVEADEARRERLTGPVHPLLGAQRPGAGVVWESDVGLESHPFLRDHGLDGKAVFPAAGYLELLLAAVAQGRFDSPIELSDVHFERVLWLDHPVLVQTIGDEAGHQVAIHVKPASGGRAWERHARGRGRLRPRLETDGARGQIPMDAQPIDLESLYERFARAGHLYGPCFRTLRQACVQDGVCWARLTLDPALHGEAARYFIHPALLDGSLQLALSSVAVDEEREAMYLPIHVDHVSWERPAGADILCRVRNVQRQDVRWYADIDLFTPGGERVASFQRCCCLKKEHHYRLAASPATLYRESWQEAAVQAAPGVNGEKLSWLIWDWTGTGAFLATAMAQRGFQVQYRPGKEIPTDSPEAVVVWAAGALAEHSEPSTEALFAATWPLIQFSQRLANQPRGVTQLVLVTAGATWGHLPNVPSPAAEPFAAPLLGLFRTVATELSPLRCTAIDIDPEATQQGAAEVLQELASDHSESEVAYRDGRRFVQRLQVQPLKELERRTLPDLRRATASFGLESLTPGNIDRLAWVEREPAPLAEGEIEIAVRAVGLNFRDVLKALDLYPLEPGEPRWFGDECAGVVRRVGPSTTRFRVGDEVVAVAPGCFGNIVRVHGCLAAKKPARLSFPEAATIPIAFLTADYSLTDVARLRPGERVLIHAAAGGVGQAAVQLAHAIGATVLGTASPEKQEFLRAQGVEHVFTSRDLSFVDGVRAATGGAGVDVVLNSLSGEFLTKSLGLLEPLGRFVEIGKKDIFQNEALDLHAFRTAISFNAVDLARVIASRPAWVGGRLEALLHRCERGELVPLPQMIFPCRQIQEAFRLMAQGKHRGKVVLTFEEANLPEEILAAPAPLIRSDATYLVTGGLSGFGWATAEWLVEQGATSLVLTGRRGPRTPAIQATIDEWRARGLRVRVARCDVTDPAATAALLREIQAELPPLRGIIHSAMVLRDEPLARVTAEAFTQVLAPKIQGAWNLHQASLALPLDFFVLYSSCATLFGSAGQASYVAANRFLDALAAFRRARGLPALSVNWGPLADFGVVADSPALARHMETVGLTPLSRDDVFAWLKFLLRRDLASAAVMQVNWPKYDAISKVRERYFAPVMTARADSGGGLRQRLAEAAPAERRPLLLAHLRRVIASVLEADEASLDDSAPLTSLGLDSLMAFEFKVKIDQELNITFPVSQLSSETRLGQLPDLLLAQLDPGNNPEEPPSAKPEPTPVPVGAAVENDGFMAIVPRQRLAVRRFDAAALTYLPEKLHTIGGLDDEQMRELFGRAPFVSNYFEMPRAGTPACLRGRIGIIMLPVRSQALFHQPNIVELIGEAIALAEANGATCISLTGLIPSATDYGLAIDAQRRGDTTRSVLTTGHATTSAAVVHNLRELLRRVGRPLPAERVAVLGLGSIGQSCLRLMLEVLPHPRELILCDLFARENVLRDFSTVVRDEHGYRGRLHIVAAHDGIPDEVYAARTILAAVSVPEVLDVERLRPGTVIVDDSYPPALSLSRAIRRLKAQADILFSNAGMLRLPEPIHETLIVPDDAEEMLEQFGVAAFRGEVVRDPRELTACVLSSLLTGRQPAFGATLGLARIADLVSHYRGLEKLGITAARPQCENYFIPQEAIDQFARSHGGTAGRKGTLPSRKTSEVVGS